MIYLKYKNDSNTWSAVESFSELVFKTIPNVERETKTALNGKNYSHKKYSFNNYSLVISANELYKPSKFVFLTNFYLGNAWQISTDGTTYNDVIMITSGEMPIDYIEGNLNLKEITLNFIDKN
jgi:hypothetical protein